MGTEPPALPKTVDTTTLEATAAGLGAAYDVFLNGLSATALNRAFLVPWFKREFTLRDGLIQVATHSIEHRADLASAISRIGLATPPLDYIFWVTETSA